MKIKKVKINLPDIVGKGYGTFWRFKGRYKVVKGSRASKKSKTIALWIIYHMMKYKGANTLVVRKTYRTLKDSCFTELKWAARRFQVDHLWQFKESPLEATYLPTGQKIYFRGLDDPLKVTSITVENGSLCWAWLEEAYEVMNQSDFDTLDESIRGELEDGLWKQWLISFNPWNERHWLKSRFFDVYSEDVLAITTDYRCNEWLDETDKKLFEDMKKNNLRRYQVAGLGNWGIVDGLVYENWKEEMFVPISKEEFDELETKDENYIISDKLKTVAGMDFGYTNDPTAFFIGFLDIENKKLYVWDEMYKKGLSNKAIKNNIVKLGYGKEKIVCDSAEPKSIDELKSLGLRVKGAKKGKDSISNGIQWIQDLEIIIHPRCVNFITEISNYMWDEDKFGKKINKPKDDFNHLMDAMRYALEEHVIGNTWMY